MSTVGVIFADFVECGGHLHLQWRCPDCGRIGKAGLEAATESFRVVCVLSRREFLVLPDPVPEFSSETCRGEALNTFK